MLGFPLNMPLTSIERAIELVFNTGVHLDDQPDTEFALAVRLHAYPNEVYSLWIYVATIQERKPARRA